MIYCKLFIIFVSCYSYGAGATRLMYRLLDVMLRDSSGDDRIKNIKIILGWFVGSGALMLGTLKVSNLAMAINFAEAEGVALIGYLGGFGLGLLLIERWSQPSFIRELKRYLSDTETEAVLLILRYDLDIEEAAKKLSVSKNDIQGIYTSALQKLNKNGKKNIERIMAAVNLKAQSVPTNETPSKT